MPAARAKFHTPNVQMPKKSQFQKTNPNFETFCFNIVWGLAFGVWSLAFRVPGRVESALALRAALPDAYLDLVTRVDANEFNIGAVGKDRMVFKQRPKLREIDALQIRYKDEALRIAHR